MATTETLEIRQLARQFAESELRPHVEQWDHDGALAPGVLAQLAELGFFGMLVPEAYGGMDFDLPTYVAAIEELAWGEPSVALTVAITNLVAGQIVAHGTDAQKRQWLESMARGEAIACVAGSEDKPSRVVRAGDRWVLNGAKRWVTNARIAKVALLAAGDHVFVLPTDTPGFAVAKRDATLGFRPVEIATVELNDLRLDADATLAIDVADFASGSLVGGLGMAAIAVGIAQAALDHALAYADVREQFSQKLRYFEGLQFKFADMAIRTEAARIVLREAAAAPSVLRTAMAKVFASEGAMWVTTQAVQIFGGYGYMRDYPVEKLMRDAKATELLQGPNEIQRVTIARELYE